MLSKLYYVTNLTHILASIYLLGFKLKLSFISLSIIFLASFIY